MNIILSNKNDFQIAQFKEVSNIAYDYVNKLYTITYGAMNDVAIYDANNWIVTILV